MKRSTAYAATGLPVLALALTALTVPAIAAPPTIAPAVMAPYYVDLDQDGDLVVTTSDLDVVASFLGLTSESPDWDAAAGADVDSDGVITVSDLAEVSSRMIYDDGPFELVEASVIDLQAAMNAGVTTSVEITQEYLERIAAYDEAIVEPDGRTLNAVISTNEEAALNAAATADAIRAESGMTSALLGVPLTLKDNYNTSDMATTAGCGCWDDNFTETDATIVNQLRQEGAVILSKASLDEFAYGFVSEFSSYQEAGTSTLVASPYNTKFTAGGSSGGTGAGVSANLAAIGFGTDTGGSIRVPSSYNQLVGIRPTVGLASRSGIVPLALSQDTGGPMARSVFDAAIALEAVVGVDETDPVTSRQDGLVPESYTQFLDENALEGATIGYIPSMLGSNPTTIRLWNEAKERMTAAGATVVEVTPPSEASPNLPQGFQSVLGEGSGSTNEFMHDLNEYIDAYLAPGVQARSLEDIIESDRFVPSRLGTYQQRSGISEETYQNWAGPEGSHTKVLAAGKELTTQLLDDYGLDALVYPSGNPYGTQSTNLRLSPNTGMPAVTVPMGQATEADGTVTGANVNLEFLGRDFDEGTLLGLTYAFESLTNARTSPAHYPALED